ncbi:ferrichrome ABC transporter substrate-binding protein [Bacteroides ovatus]|nr:ferrichrome ABC transporter substrate-binding protein [Bacteroides ovatus]
MEDFLKFLLIAGVILVGIFKEVNKNSKSKKAKNKRPVSPMPSPVEVAPDAVPMPEAWGGPKSLEELFQPKPLKQTPPQQSPKQTAKPAAQQKRKKERNIRFRIPGKQCRAR